MSHADNNPVAGRDDAAARDALRHQDDSARLAHELANLLDGSLRNVSLAITSLAPAPGGDASDTDEQALAKLNTASEAMHQMATLIQQWMRSAPPALDSHHGSLGEAIDHAVDLYTPAARDKRIVIDADVSADAGALPAGAAFTLVTNALRNALEAFEDQDDRRVELRVACEQDDIAITVTDTGSGIEPNMLDDRGHFRFGFTTKPAGHGLGLVLCRDIVHKLGGTITLSNHPPHGAQLAIRFPVHRHHG